MKFLTSITIVMAIPTMVSGFFGMNVDLPLTGPNSFWLIFMVTVFLCAIAGLVLYRKKMF
jgi:magnesium transporter